jgi:hypothetical protein
MMAVLRVAALTAMAVVLVLRLGGATVAAAPEPPGQGHTTDAEAARAEYAGHPDAGAPFTFHSSRFGAQPTVGTSEPITLTGTTAPDALTVLGQPGLSFRYVRSLGVTEQAYTAGFGYLNRPNGLSIDAAGSVYVAEEQGDRLLAFDSVGAGIWKLGNPGMQDLAEYGFTLPKDVARDPAGNIWVADEHRLTQYNANGTFLQMFPKPQDRPWACAGDNGHFCVPRGIAFDTAGRMFVSDEENHRVQVFSLASGSPVYVATVGVSGEPGNDNAHFNFPAQIAFDASNRLYVADMGNARVQRCVAAGSGWTCTTFHGTGLDGSGPNALHYAFGLGTDTAGNVYIADSGNGRVKKCNSAGTCTIFISGLGWPSDVATDSASNVYVSVRNDFTVRKYASNGTFLQVFAGNSGVPYIPDTVRLNAPRGVTVAPDGSIYAVENRGYRLVKMDASGAQQWAAGEAGVWGADNAHFGSEWVGLEGNPAVSAGGTVYVTDTANDRVQVFNADGAFLTTFGSSGQGENQFSCPSGASISPATGDVLIVDHCNHRIQVFAANGTYRATLGVTGASGTDSAHFSYPSGVAVDASGQIFVADSNNFRVQRCVLTGTGSAAYTCTTFAGVTGQTGNDFAHLGHPVSVAVDRAGRVYVADDWNSRVQVFDSGGAYVTTVGGSVGSRSGDMRGPEALAVDGTGNIYVADIDNHRIQEFASGVPGWQQININGFGSPASPYVLTLAPFGGQLYAAAQNSVGGAQLWRRDGNGWTVVRDDGFGSANNIGVDHLVEYKGKLYAGTWNESSGGEIWRSSDGSSASWIRVVSGGFGDSYNAEVFRLLSTTDYLYAATWNYSGTRGGEIWRSTGGDAGSWTRVVVDGFNGDPGNVGATSMEFFSGYLYAGTANFATGGEVWRSATGGSGSWQQVNANGFGRASNGAISALTAFNGRLYASTQSGSGAGAEVWRCTLCNGSDWVKVVENGFGDPESRGVSALEVFRDQLCFVVGNLMTGMQVWTSTTGNPGEWQQTGFAGFGDSNNRSPYWDNSVAVVGNSLLIGTGNYANGGELWQLLPNKLYLPLVQGR